MFLAPCGGHAASSVQNTYCVGAHGPSVVALLAAARSDRRLIQPNVTQASCLSCRPGIPAWSGMSRLEACTTDQAGSLSYVNKAPGGFLLPAPILGGRVAWLLNCDHKRDALTVRQVDAERVRRVSLEIAGGHIENPDPTAIAKRSVRNVVKRTFVRVRNLAADCTQHSQLTSGPRENGIRIGDWIPIRITQRELHRDGAASLREYATAVSVDWLQDNASRTIGPVHVPYPIVNCPVT